MNGCVAVAAARATAARAATGTRASSSIARQDAGAAARADDRQQPPLAVARPMSRVTHDGRRTRAGWSGTSRSRAAKSGSRAERGRSERRRGAPAAAGPTIERTRSGTSRAVGRCAARRSRSRPPRPTGPASFSGGGDVGEVLEELRRHVLVGRVVLGEHERDLEQVRGSTSPSTPCRRTARACPPTGSGAERSNGPMLSRPRKPPSKTLLPSASLRFTHQVKLISSLWKIALEEVVVACRRRSRTPAAPPTRAPAG